MRQLKPLESRQAIANRLRTAEGHLHAVTGMVESGAPCEEVWEGLALWTEPGPGLRPAPLRPLLIGR